MKGILTILVLLAVVYSISYLSVYGKPDFMKDENHQTIKENNNEIEIIKYNEIQKQNLSSESNTCDVCGNSFLGNGFTEIKDGTWKETQEPYQTYICSKSCGLKHTGKWNKKLEDLNIQSSEKTSGYSTGSDGRLYENKNCSLCEGTGIESSSTSLGNVNRVCPMCQGKGSQNY